MYTWRKSMLDFHSKEMNRKFLSWLQNKSIKYTEDVDILWLFIRLSSARNLIKNVDDLSKILIDWKMYF